MMHNLLVLLLYSADIMHDMTKPKDMVFSCTERQPHSNVAAIMRSKGRAMVVV